MLDDDKTLRGSLVWDVEFDDVKCSSWFGLSVGFVGSLRQK